MSGADGEPSLEERIWDRMDPDGSLRSGTGAFRLLASNPIAHGVLGLLGVSRGDLANVVEVADQAESHIAAMQRVVEIFSVWGWAPSGLVPTDPYRDALRAIDAGQDTESVESLLVDGWRDSMLPYLRHRVMALGAADDDYAELFHARGRLVGLAWEDHLEGRYHASVPMIAAQIEGICFDVTDRPFFSKRKGVVPVDDTSLAGLNEGLPVAREWFSANVDATTLEAEPSRHGVLHGRSLRYDSELISTKYFVLLAAVWEWARPLAGEEASRRRAEHLASVAGSQENRPHGRRVDDREFDVTQSALRDLYFAQLGWRRRGEFRFDLVEIMEGGSFFDELPEPHGLTMTCSEDQETWWAWRRTISGWVLGIAGSGDQRQWLWSGPDEPAERPPGGGWFDAMLGTPPDWE